MRLTLKILLPALALAALAAVPAQADASPWWQLLSGARPTHIAPAPDDTEVQEVKTIALPGGVGFGARVEVSGKTVGCLGSGFGLSICKPKTGFAATQTAAGFEEMLEGTYGADVEVSGGPVGGAPFLVTTPGHWVPQVRVTPLFFKNEIPELGSASVNTLSEGSGRLTITLTNLGNSPMDATSAPLQIEDELPEGIEAYGARAEAGARGVAGPVECTVQSTELVGCAFEGVLSPYEAIEVEVLVAMTGSAGAPGKVSVLGGDAPAVSEEQAVTVSEEPVPFGMERFEMRAEDDEGNEVTAAGSRPFQLTTTIVANSGAQSGPDRNNAIVEQPAMARNLRFTLPAGLVGSATAAPQCEMADFFVRNSSFDNNCPDDTAIGVSSVTLNERATLKLARLAVPVFNRPLTAASRPASGS
jgi:hypothetical protein